MNDDLVTNGITVTATTLPIMANGSTITASSIGSIASITKTPDDVIEDLLDTYSMNQVVMEHRVAEFEMMKMGELDIDHANIIKGNMAKGLSDEIIKRASFTKKRDVNMDTHLFYGRVWVFNKEELKQLIKDARNA